MKGTQENRELAYIVYERYGGRDIRGMLEALKDEHNIAISAQTLHQWKRDGRWNDALADSADSYEERLYLKLTGLIERFEQHLNSEQAPNPQVTYAYTNLIDSFLRLSSRIPKNGRNTAGMPTLEEVLRNEYGIER